MASEQASLVQMRIILNNLTKGFKMNFKAKLELIDLVKQYGSTQRLYKSADLKNDESLAQMWHLDGEQTLDKIISILETI